MEWVPNRNIINENKVPNLMFSVNSFNQGVVKQADQCISNNIQLPNLLLSNPQPQTRSRHSARVCYVLIEVAAYIVLYPNSRKISNHPITIGPLQLC